jgi:hypothetical protein
LLLLPPAQHSDVKRDSAAVGSDIDESAHLMRIARSVPGDGEAGFEIGRGRR